MMNRYTVLRDDHITNANPDDLYVLFEVPERSSRTQIRQIEWYEQ